MGDIKHYLRKMDFPAVVPEALHHIQKLWLYDCTPQQVMKELAAEFVFFEIDKWGGVRRQKLQPLKELQVLERISWYFSSPGNEKKTATFLFLFPLESQALETRLPFLARLLSIAIAILNGNVLNYVGMWMQLCGCTSNPSMYIAKTVLQEHFKVVSSTNIPKELPQIAPLFCASFVTAVTNLYLTSSPPLHVADIILEWMKTSPVMCFSPFKMTVPPQSFSYRALQTPLPGLLCWCILAPLHKDRSNSLEVKLKENCDARKNYDDIFSLLHLAILQCLLKASSVNDLSRYEVLPVESVIAIVDTLKKCIIPTKDCIKISLDRLAQGLEIALSSHCIHAQRGKLGELFILCCDLPYNRLLKIVLKRWSAALQSANPL